MQKFNTLLQAQRAHFFSDATKDTKHTLTQLKRLKKALQDNETLLYEAIAQDFSKSAFETYATELSILYEHINYFIKHLHKLKNPKKVRTSFANLFAKNYIYPEPLGVVLVIGTWNYPYQLSILPAIGALAAGNCVIIKPSEIAPNSSQVMADVINSNFDNAYLHVVQGDATTTTALLEHKFDKIFFTGSTQVGKIIYEQASKHLTPVVLELGGKSPTFVLEDASIALAAKRIAWAKFLNAGQTCIAPDYIVVARSVANEFIDALQNYIDTHYDSVDATSPHYVQIINDKHLKRLTSLDSRINTSPNRIIKPTLLIDVDFDAPVMQEEIFGPILPIIIFDDLQAVVDTIKKRPKPLACYIYSENQKQIDFLLKTLSFGGGAINDSIMHITNMRLPFGGVGDSGLGHYHGAYSFDTFTHHKSILKQSNRIDMPLKYPPYSKLKLKLLRFLFD